MDMEALVLGLMNARLIEKTLAHESSAERESFFMEDSTRRAFDSRMKGDACVSRQAARNMLDAQTMVDVAKNATIAIKDQLSSIKSAIEDPEHDFRYKQTEINTCISEILRLAENTEFNGKKLMDGSAGTNGVVELQAGNSEKELCFMNLLDRTQDSVLGDGSSMDLNKLSAAIFSGDSIQESALGTVESLLKVFSTLCDRYAYESESLGNLAQMFEAQADIFDKARTDNAAMTTSTGDASSDASYLDRLLAASGQSSILSGTT